MNRLIRFLAVIAIALSPVWGFSGKAEARPAAWPTYPGFFSTNCNGLSGPTGIVSMACSAGGYVTTQVLSGYECTELDINVSVFGSGPFIATATVQSGTVNNTLTIDGTGNYFMKFPFYLQQNTIVIQLTAPQSGSMTIGDINTTTCPVATPTPTINPSSTATNTPVPVTGTPTPIPTFTPLPSGHSTFTRTPTPAPSTNTPAPATPTPTVTPSSLTEIDCGESSFPLLNCNQAGSGNLLGAGNQFGFHWGQTADLDQHCVNGSTGGSFASGGPWQSAVYYSPGGGGNCNQGPILAGLTGIVHIVYTTNQYGTSHVALTFQIQNHGGNWGSPCEVTLEDFTVSSVEDRSTGCSVTSGSNYDVGWLSTGSGDITLSDVYVLPSGATPGTATASPTLTGTITPTPVPGTVTSTPTPTDSPIPIPGAMSTNIPTATECPGGCVVTQLTAIPGMATRVTVDTSPFSPFTSLSLSRSSCAPFGYVAIPYPVVHGTPAYGSTTPLSVTWTIPITAPWDDTHPFSNTAIQPCAMLNEIPSTVWDFTYWFSVFAIAVVFIMWLIGFVGRLSGEETING